MALNCTFFAYPAYIGSDEDPGVGKYWLLSWAQRSLVAIVESVMTAIMTSAEMTQSMLPVIDSVHGKVRHQPDALKSLSLAQVDDCPGMPLRTELRGHIQTYRHNVHRPLSA